MRKLNRLLFSALLIINSRKTTQRFRTVMYHVCRRVGKPSNGGISVRIEGGVTGETSQHQVGISDESYCIYQM